MFVTVCVEKLILGLPKSMPSVPVPPGLPVRVSLLTCGWSPKYPVGQRVQTCLESPAVFRVVTGRAPVC